MRLVNMGMESVEHYLIKLAESQNKGTITRHWFAAPSDLFDTKVVYSGNAKLYQDRINDMLDRSESEYRILIRINNMFYQIRMIDLRVVGVQMFDVLNTYFHDK